MLYYFRKKSIRKTNERRTIMEAIISFFQGIADSVRVWLASLNLGESINDFINGIFKAFGVGN